MSEEINWNNYIAKLLGGIGSWGDLSGEYVNAQAIAKAETLIAENEIKFDRFSHLKEKALSARIRTASVQDALDKSWQKVVGITSDSLKESEGELDKAVRLKNCFIALTKSAGYIGTAFTVADIEAKFSSGDPQELGLTLVQLIAGAATGAAVIALGASAVALSSVPVLTGAIVAGASVLASFLVDEVVEAVLPESWQEEIGNFIYDSFQYLEDAWNDVFHTAENSEDSLAVEGLLWSLDVDAMLSDIDSIFSAAAKEKGETLECIVNAFGELFGVGEKVELHNQDSLYARLEAMQSTILDMEGNLKPEFQGLTITHTATDTSDIAYRYALVHLNPFVVKGFDYTQHNQNHELDLYDEATGTGTLTGQYLKDRAEFLALLNKFNTTGKSVGGDKIEFYDKTTDTLVQYDNAYNGARKQFYFGTKDDDVIEGLANNDQLYGGGGNDTISGKGGNDYLEGGQGDDTYIYEEGDGLDTIFDVDGTGSIVFDTTTLNGGDKIGDGLYQSSDGKYTYAFNGAANGIGNLIINGVIHVENFRSGTLGITLGDYQPEEPPETAIEIIGTTGDDIPGNESGPLEGNFTSDHIMGLAGNDIIDGYANDDLLEGGLGSDIVIGGNGSDVIHAGAAADAASVIYSDSQPVGTTNDWLSGGAGNDSLYGSDGADALVGGRDKDHIWGGAGDDYILGDSEDGSIESTPLNY